MTAGLVSMLRAAGFEGSVSDWAMTRVTDVDLVPEAVTAAVANGWLVGIRAEYGVRMAGGEFRTLTTTPRLEEIYPLAERIVDARRDHGKVYRRRVIVVEDWTEADEP